MEEKSSLEIKYIQIEGIEIPAVANIDNEIYFSVKMVEGEILKYFPNIIPENASALCSMPLSNECIDLLNGAILERNLKLDFLSSGEAGVKVQDFVEFYITIKKCYPHCADKLRTLDICSEKESNNCGWILINHTVVPFIKQDKWVYLPQQILLHSAKLNVPSTVCNLMSEKDCKLMNDLCRVMKTEIVFDQNTKYIPLQFVQDFNMEINVHELNVPFGHNPVEYAKPILKYLKMVNHVDSLKPHLKAWNNNETNSALSKCDSRIKTEDSKPITSDSCSNSVGQNKGWMPETEYLPLASCFTKTVFHGKVVPCLQKDMVKYVSVETVGRLYFPFTNLETFVCKVLELVHDLKECTSIEEICFCKCNGIPIKSLKYNKLIELATFQNIFPVLNERLKIKSKTPGFINSGTVCVKEVIQIY